MSKLMLTGFVFPLFFLLASPEASAKDFATTKTSPDLQGQSGTLQRMIIENGNVTIDLDLNRLNGSAPSSGKLQSVQFAVAANSFFSVLVFNGLLRGSEQGSIALIQQNSAPPLPVSLDASIKRLIVEKLPSDAAFDLAVRDAKTSFTFFNIEGHQYDYDANAQLLRITGGRLLISKEFASALGGRSVAGEIIGKISFGAAMQPTETMQRVNGEPKSIAMPPLRGPAGLGRPTLVPGPDVIVGNLPSLQQFGDAGTQVGLAVGTESCNNGQVDADWFALPSNNHPVIPQNLYRMSGGADNTQRFEQIGQSWLKHAFTAASEDNCGFGCNDVFGKHLGSGCSDLYSTNQNGIQNVLGSRAWVNPFTGFFPGGSNPGPQDHTGHIHDGVSHRIVVEANDLNTTLNQGAAYFAESQYVVPHEYAWCQSHPGECNMYNNVSYRRFNVSGGPTNFSFSPAGSTVRMQPAIMAWTGATVNQIQPDPGNDGIWFMGYKVTNPSPGVWHYEYALYNENLDRGIQSFSVPLAPGVNISNIGFHAPPQEPGWPNDGTFNNQGYSSMPWLVIQAFDSITWNSETFAQNQNANAIRWGTLYNFRFDGDQPPQSANGTINFFKTESPITVAIQAPMGGGTPSPTPTPTASPTPTVTPSASPSSTSTPSSTPRPTPTPRAGPSPRPRPTPGPRQ
jgi:hypothetical protein